MRSLRLALALAVLALAAVRADGSARHGDAFVQESADGRRWTIGNSRLTYTLAVDANGLSLVSIGRGGDPVVQGTGPDTVVTLDGEERPFGASTGGFVFAGAEAADVDNGVLLTIGFRLRQADAVVERHYRVYPSAPVVEMWTTVDAGSELTFGDLNAMRVPVAGRDLAWVTGLDVGGDQGGPFAPRRQWLGTGDRVELGSPTLSSEAVLPYASIGGDGVRFLAGIAWSGGWRGSYTGTDGGAMVDLALPDMSAVARPGERLEFPHAFLGVVGDEAGADGEAFAVWIRARRGGRDFPALATYNTWFTRGTAIDAESAMRDMDDFAAIGGELFQLDAGWYDGPGARDTWDFTRGLGSWEVDTRRFPGGLGALADHAHARGLKFGIWVEPERVAFETVGRAGLAQERFLATADGQYRPGTANEATGDAQICLADDAARQWVLDRLVRFIDEAHPDYLKWDVNFWIRCTRTDHGHPANGGNFAHVRGLYTVLDELRARYPDLLIENCSGGGHRIDAELLTRTDASWLDDLSAPSARVRRHLQGLAPVLPAPALLSYVMAGEGEPMAGADDMALLARSRMPGIMGLTVPFSTLRERDVKKLEEQTALYKQVRELRGGTPVTLLLTEPVRADGGGPGWDAVQQFNPASGGSVVFAFRNREGDSRIRVRLQRLDQDATYVLRAIDRGPLGTFSGARLMADGLDLSADGCDAVVVFVARE